MSVLCVNEHQMVEIFGALYYDVSHNHVVVSRRKTPDIVINIEGAIRERSRRSKANDQGLRGNCLAAFLGKWYNVDV